MVAIENRNSYSEVFELLKNIDRNDLNKIPMNLLKTIKENRNEEYIPEIDMDNLDQSLSDKAMSLYIWLYREYMTDDYNEKCRINKILYDNEIKKQNDLRINRDPFKNNSEVSSRSVYCSDDFKLVKYKENIFHRIINKIKSIFRI